MLPRFKVFSFDATGTLFRVKNSVGYHYCYKELSNERPHFGACPGNRTSGAHWWSDLIKRVITKSLPAGDLQSMAKVESLPPMFYSELYDKFAGVSPLSDAAAWELYPETIPTLDRLRKQGRILSVISNFDERLYAILRDLNILNYFHHFDARRTSLITTSIDTGFSKPHPNIFDNSFERLHKIDRYIAKDDVIHIGDSLDKDYNGATNKPNRLVTLHQTKRNVFGANFENFLEIKS
eukprot:gene3987-4617_t